MFALENLHDHLRGRTIFSRLFWGFVATAMLIITVATAGYYHYASKTTEQQVQAEVELTLQQSVALFERGFMDPINGVLAMMEMSPALNNFLKTNNGPLSLLVF